METQPKRITSRLKTLIVATAALATVALGEADVATAKPSTKSVSVVAATKTIKTARITMSYRQFGKGTDLILVPGYSCTMDDWDPQFLDVLARKHRVTVFNHDGVGMTQAGGTPISEHILAEDMSSLIATLKLNKPNVLGLSLGGIISQDFAINHADQMNRLILAASTTNAKGIVPPSQAALASLGDTTTPIQQTWKLFFPDNHQDRIAPYIARLSKRADYHAMTIPESLGMRGVIGAFVQNPNPQNLGAIKTRTLVAAGELDQVTRAENSKYISTQIAGSELVIYPDSGHAFHEQYALKFGKRVNEFLAKK
jgi:pimeloyl-ACP methyl ester carboxylesterase